MNNRRFAKRKLAGLSSRRNPICDPNPSPRIVLRDNLREGLAVAMTTSPVDLAVRMLNLERNPLKRYLPTRDEIARECSAIRKQWSPAERARRWRGRLTKGE